MAENSKIEWCDATVNMWWGCSKISPGCAHCYADTLAHRWGKDIWGPGKPREDHRAGATKLAMRLERAAAAGRFRQCSVCGKREIRKGDGIGLVCCSNPDCTALPETESAPVRPRVFSPSMSDWLDDEVPIEWLADLLRLINETPNLDWLLLSKRPQNWRKRIEDVYTHSSRRGTVQEMAEAWIAQCPLPNIWIGTTVEDQQRADERIPELLKIPAKVRFLSCEPLLGPVWLPLFGGTDVAFPADFAEWPEARRIEWFKDTARAIYISRCANGIHWVIAGGESGPGARPMHPLWVRGLRNQCQAASVPFLFKQWGDWLPYGECAPGVDDPRDKEGVLHNYSFGATAPVVPWYSRKIGKARAGRILDGREWNEFPTP